MGMALNLNENNFHQVEVEGRQLLFHIPSSSLFEADETLERVITGLRQWGPLSAEELGARLGGVSVTEALADLDSLGIVSGTAATTAGRLSIPDKLPLTTVVLNVNTGCNLSCTYCYKEDLATPTAGEKMQLQTAIDSLEMLLAQSPEQPRYNVVFFGGEPLSNLPLIREVVDFAEQRFRALGKRVDFSLTTNATMLNAKTIEYLDSHCFGIAVSIDGPKAIHDRNRITVGGQGTYETVARKVDLLLSSYRSRPVGARVTLTRGITDIELIWDHLFNELGFAEVGFAPVTAGDMDSFNLAEEELVAVFAGMKRLGERYVEEALQHRNIGFSNLHQLLTDIHEGTKKALPCGAGYSMVAVDKDGGVNLCHRFTGSELPTFGSVSDGRGLDVAALGEFLSHRLDRSNTGCNTCHIRNLCSGGCYHESYQRYNDPAHPVYHYCELMRDWVDFGVGAYARIAAANPRFFTDYITPRRAS
ncbi:quinohemoprotein amine dehydrogenase maturation protein [Haliea sp. E1-2-M8]|uniref:quinohemoprotein amine dehydrogenase maturation protein n=1 Tax=Haliea sp. E1-2-M8 TaxID=3064706 RepID=UPI0027190C50|nr:quinohemoprotein amine dehydrogenase maturation protein [Haliea sp. E1-2-M8]MDO8862656.1 quinohemoprotein amine dehydrogenase maturation protein [Haliea sp. E1-2-M8]